MKCPSCGFVGSDQRDVCAKCYIDLRPMKRQLGIPISNSSATHAELLAHFGIKLEVAERKSRSILEFFGFGGNKEDSESLKVLPTAVSVPEEIAKNITIPVVLAPEVGEAPRGVEVKNKKLELKPVSPLSASSALSASQTVGNSNDPIVSGLFAECFQDLSQSDFAPEFSIQTEQLFDPSKSKGLNVLYDLAYDVLERPELENQLVDEFTKSEQRQVEATGLVSMLVSIEKRITAPVFGLKSIMAESRRRAQKAESEEPVVAMEAAAVPERLFCSAIDYLSIFVLAFGSAALTYSSVEEASFFEALKSSSGAELSLPLGLIVAFLAIWSIFYPLLCLVVYRATIGTKLTGLVIVNEKQRRPRLQHSLVRAIIGPLNIVFLGWFPVIFGRRSMADWASKTSICRKQAVV